MYRKTYFCVCEGQQIIVNRDKIAIHLAGNFFSIRINTMWDKGWIDVIWN